MEEKRRNKEHETKDVSFFINIFRIFKNYFLKEEHRARERRSRRSSADYRLPGRSKSKDEKATRDKSRVKSKSSQNGAGTAGEPGGEAGAATAQIKLPRPPQTSKNTSGIKMPDPRLILKIYLKLF